MRKFTYEYMERPYSDPRPGEPWEFSWNIDEDTSIYRRMVYLDSPQEPVTPNNNDEENHEQTLGDVIREARTSKGYSLRTFATLLGITPSYQSDIENDRRIPAEEVVKRIADLLSLDFDSVMVMAGRFGEQAERYLKRQPEAIRLFRKISEANLNEENLKNLQRQVEQKDNLK